MTLRQIARCQRPICLTVGLGNALAVPGQPLDEALERLATSTVAAGHRWTGGAVEMRVVAQAPRPGSSGSRWPAGPVVPAVLDAVTFDRDQVVQTIRFDAEPATFEFLSGLTLFGRGPREPFDLPDGRVIEAAWRPLAS